MKAKVFWEYIFIIFVTELGEDQHEGVEDGVADGFKPI